jgi:hypothetical protein
VQGVEFRSRDNKLVLAEFQLSGSVSSHPVPLPAASRAEFARPTGSRPRGQGSAAPSAVNGH